MVDAGLWDDVDVNISWHPGYYTEADVQSTLSLIDFQVEFFGQAAHASMDPWNGRSSSDALELYTSAINYYREHVQPTVRMHITFKMLEKWLMLSLIIQNYGFVYVIQIELE